MHCLAARAQQFMNMFDFFTSYTPFILRWLVLVFCSIGCTADTVFLKGATAFRSAGEMDPCALAFWSALCKDAKGPSRLTKCQHVVLLE